MNNRSSRWGLSRRPSLTSFSGLWKCLTIPLMASPTPSWIWPVFNSARAKKEGKPQTCLERIQGIKKALLSLAFDVFWRKKNPTKKTTEEVLSWNPAGIFDTHLVCCLARWSQTSSSSRGTVASAASDTSARRSQCWGSSAPPPGSSPGCRRPLLCPTSGRMGTCGAALHFNLVTFGLIGGSGDGSAGATLTCTCGPWSRCGRRRTPPATLRRAPCCRGPSAPWWVSPGSGTGGRRDGVRPGHNADEESQV